MGHLPPKRGPSEKGPLSRAVEPYIISNDDLNKRFVDSESNVPIFSNAEKKKLEEEYLIENPHAGRSYADCLGCGETHLLQNMINLLCSDCQWECPQCEQITLKPKTDYICQVCRYGDTNS